MSAPMNERALALNDAVDELDELYSAMLNLATGLRRNDEPVAGAKYEQMARGVMDARSVLARMRDEAMAA